MKRYRLTWDVLATDWSDPVPDTYNVIQLPPPTHWRFDAHMINELKGQIALEATSIKIEFQEVTE